MLLDSVAIRCRGMHPLALGGWICMLVLAALQFSLGMLGEYVPDLAYSLEFWAICVTCVVTLRLQRAPVASLFFFFECCFFVFIGGRLLSLPLLPLDAPGSPFDLEFMAEYRATQHIRSLAFFLVVIFVGALNIGYFTASWKLKPSRALPFNGRIAVLLLALMAVPMTYLALTRLKLAFSQGYQAQYLGQTSAYQVGNGLLEAVYFVLLGLAYVTPGKFARRLVLCLLAIHGVVGMAAGGRGQFLTIMALMLWLYGRKRDISLWMLMLIFTMLGTCANLLLQFSARNAEMEVTSILGVVTGMLWDQGVSLGVFSYSLSVANYPLLAYVQTIFPGTAWVASLFSGHGIDPTQLSFAARLSSIADPDMFLNGNGLGWSVLGDLALFSGGIVPVFALLCLFAGWGLRALDDGARISVFWLALAVALGPRLFFLPRAALSTVIPFLFYFLLIFWLLRLLGGARRAHRSRA
jgi:hypothetical protein